MRPTAAALSEETTLIDPVERTGCEIENETVLLCYAETKDWRKCKKELEAFKKCMKLYEQRQQEGDKTFS